MRKKRKHSFLSLFGLLLPLLLFATIASITFVFCFPYRFSTHSCVQHTHAGVCMCVGNYIWGNNINNNNNNIHRKATSTLVPKQIKAHSCLVNKAVGPNPLPCLLFFFPWLSLFLLRPCWVFLPRRNYYLFFVCMLSVLSKNTVLSHPAPVPPIMHHAFVFFLFLSLSPGFSPPLDITEKNAKSLSGVVFFIV
ncbi:MAG: hypothetical protein J3R72DRAFT_464216 [Linnemannia gamsii]|nr:MAG: hypothetical protein J3R72DRAFT_464216 [Linnemannia gamsii]